jgi:hypothetical protein
MKTGDENLGKDAQAQRCYSHKGKHLRHLLSMPFIYVMAVPLLVLDAFLELYHRVCFPLFGLPHIQRSQYFTIDREKLPYLSWLQKFNCFYCTYANGLFLYASAIAAETERYWCPIKHQTDGFKAPAHQAGFAAFGDEKGFRKMNE